MIKNNNKILINDDFDNYFPVIIDSRSTSKTLNLFGFGLTVVPITEAVGGGVAIAIKVASEFSLKKR